MNDQINDFLSLSSLNNEPMNIDSPIKAILCQCLLAFGASFAFSVNLILMF